MKNLLIVVASLFFANLRSQTDSVKNYQTPQFQGGRTAFYKYLDTYMTFPAIEREKGTKRANLAATIYVSKEGKIKFVNVMGENAEFKNQVKRILTLMPNWNCGKWNGIPTDTFVIQKIWFSHGESRNKKDTCIYEYRLYETRLTNEESLKWQKEMQDKAESLRGAKELYNKAAVEFNKRNFTESAKLFGEARERGLESTDLYFNLAVSQLKSGDKESACPNFIEAARKGDEEAYKLYLKLCK